jgi:hypothetical protein
MPWAPEPKPRADTEALHEELQEVSGPTSWGWRQVAIGIAVLSFMVCVGVRVARNAAMAKRADRAEITVSAEFLAALLATVPPPMTLSATPVVAPSVAQDPISSRVRQAAALPHMSATLPPDPSRSVALPQNTSEPTPQVLAQVLQILDERTILVSLNGSETRVRYLGLADLSDESAMLRNQARAANAILVDNQTVLLENEPAWPIASDVIECYVWAGSQMVNAALLKQGLGRIGQDLTGLRYATDLAHSEAEAQADALGIWWSAVTPAGETPTDVANQTPGATQESASTHTPQVPTPTVASVLTTPTSQPSATPTVAPSHTPPVSPVPTATAPSPSATPPPPPSASGTGNVRIAMIFFDGENGRAEPDEYCELVNEGSEAVNLAGWRLNAGAPNQDMVFADFALASGQHIRVYTNEVHAEWGGLTFASKAALWKNDGDCGYLYDASGAEKSSYCY